jgi:23S rRNA (uridine2479-2'-O)-methyltransferase
MGARTLSVHSENQWFQKVQTLKTNRQKRSACRQFFVEGVRSINKLRGASRWKAAALLYAGGRRLSGWARDVLSEIDAQVHLELAPVLMDKLSDKEEGSEILAVVEMPDTRPADIAPGVDGVVVLLDRPSNPGNLGSIIRSCDAFGVRGILVTGHAVDVYDPAVIRASAGAFFNVPVARAEGPAAVDSWLAGLDSTGGPLRVIGTSAKAELAIGDCDLAPPLVLCFGNETMGLSENLKQRCRELAGIPMKGTATSLNLACAVTAVLYEADRQRSGATGSSAPSPRMLRDH